LPRVASSTRLRGSLPNEPVGVETSDVELDDPAPVEP